MDKRDPERNTYLSENQSEEFTEAGFFNKLKQSALSAGQDVVELALKMFYALQDKDTPAAAKTTIIGALLYFIIPTDAVLDFLPGGYVDDWGALVAAFWTVSQHIKDEHVKKAKLKAKDWFG